MIKVINTKTGKSLGLLDDDAVEIGLRNGVDLLSGVISKQDRCVIFARKFPGTSKSGYCLRARIVWWLYTSEVLKGGEFDIHHINHDRSDDRIENLSKISHAEHTHEHHGYRWENVTWIKKTCANCKNTFSIELGKINEKGANRGKFCSQQCYHQSDKSSRKLKEQKYCFNSHLLTKKNSFPIKYKHAVRKGCKICKYARAKKARDARKKS